MKIKFSISLLLLVFAFTNNIVKGQSKKLIEFKPTDESLSKYKYPEWFKDAKFGIWAHWGPQAVPRQEICIDKVAHNTIII
jgi:alpha-L-fucosidase